MRSSIIYRYPHGHFRGGYIRVLVSPTITSSDFSNNNFVIELNDEMTNGLWFNGKFINEGDGVYLGTTDNFFRGGLEGISRCIKANGQDAGVCVRFENLKIKSMRDFHKHCRVVYRAMRNRYGKEKVQDECLRVFKVLFPLLHKARTTGECGFSDEDRKRIRRIFESWKPKKNSELDTLLGNILNRMDEPFTKEGFIQFCEDILVVVMTIRKLTPRECGRLMAVSEKDIDTMLCCGVSKSALYKLYGNSIVSGTGTKDSQGNYDGVLFNIFRTLFIDTEPPKIAGTQLLFF